MPFTIPIPARRIGTSANFMSTVFAVVLHMGVVTKMSVKGTSRVAS
jgi:hypothetical protein